MNLKLNHRLGVTDIKYFNAFTLDLKFDSVASTFGFKCYLDPYNREHAESACVSHFHEAIVEHNGKTLVTGYILSNNFVRQSKKQLVQFGGYSKPGVFEDCHIPTDLYPLETSGLSLAQIAKKLAAPFKIKVVVDPDVSSIVNKVIQKTTPKETQTIKDYLTELATQKDIIITHNEKGDLLFTKAKTNLSPLFEVSDGIIGTDIELSFDGQAMHSHITVVKQADSGGGNSGEYTIENPYCPIVYRPKTVTQTSGDDISVKETAKNELIAELKNIRLTITTDRWEVNGAIILPNNLVTVYSPENFIYKKTDWFIESIKYEGDEKQTIATLNCVLPEVYNGKEIKNIFVNPHENFPRINA